MNWRILVLSTSPFLSRRKTSTQFNQKVRFNQTGLGGLNLDIPDAAALGIPRAATAVGAVKGEGSAGKPPGRLDSM